MSDCLGSNSKDDMHGDPNTSNDIFGFGDQDMIWGKGGNDDVKGGNNADYIEGGNDSDYLDGSDGDDTWSCGGVYCGVEGQDAGDNAVTGSNGEDVVNGGGGDDWMEGDGEDDRLFAHTDSSGGDSVFADAGNDHCWVDPNDNWFECEHVHQT